MMTTPGVNVQEKHATDSVYFTPGSIFAVAVSAAGSTITVAPGVSLTLSVAASNYTNSAPVNGSLYYTSKGGTAVKLCQFSDGQFTVAGLGLVCQGPNEFQLMATPNTSHEVHVSGIISRTDNSVVASAPEADIDNGNLCIICIIIAIATLIR